MANTGRFDGDELISQIPATDPMRGLPPDNHARIGVHRVNVCDLDIDVVSLEKMLQCLAHRIRQRLPAYVVTPNVDHVCCWHRNIEFRRAYAHAFLVLPDGMPLLWSARLLGTPLGPKLSGSDLIYHIAEFAEQKQFSIFLMGAAPGVADKVAIILKSLFPMLKVAGTYSPPKGFQDDPAQNDLIVSRLKTATPDICLLALSGPLQEIWMYQNHKQCSVPMMIGVGAAFDFVAGTKRRAPRALQRTGLEWFWRLCLEPRRLWRRYLVDDAAFFSLLAHQLAMQIRNPNRRAFRTVVVRSETTPHAKTSPCQKTQQP